MAISTVSFSKTPQAVNDRAQDATIVATSINVLGNDLGGNGKTLYSIDDGTSATLNGGPSDLLKKDTIGAFEYSALGAKIWMKADGTIGYDPSTISQANLPAAGTSRVDSFTYAIQLGDGSLSVAKASVWIGNAGPTAGNVSGTAVEDGPSSSLYALQFAADDFTPVSALVVTPGTLPPGVTYDATAKTFTLNPAAAEYQPLEQGEHQLVTVNFTVTDSAGASVGATATWDVTGVNDAASISGTASGAVTEDVTPAAGGTLSVSDVDHTENVFAAVDPSALVGAYGSFTFANGTWDYTLNNASADVQALAAGETAHDYLTVKSKDGTATQVIDVTITGTNDAASISGTASGAVTEDGTLAAGGTVSVSDVDHGENVFAPVDPSALVGAYGSFTFTNGTWDYTLNNVSADVQALAAGEVAHDQLSLTSKDGTGHQTIDVTITGTNDAASISGTATGVATEDGTLTAGGTLSVSDVDHGENVFAPVDDSALTGAYGSFTFVDGTWGYTLSNDAGNVQSLTQGEAVHDKLVVDSKDGTAHQTIDVTITGTNDAASISGTATGAVTEDGTPATGGTLSVSDVDHGENVFAPVDDSALTGAYGSFTFADGTWGYTLNNDAGNVQSLTHGESVHDKLVVDSKDGTAHQTIDVTIVGTNDLASITGGATGAVTEDGTLNAGGSLAVSDVDHGEATFESVADSSLHGTYGDFTFDTSTGAWTYLLRNGDANVQSLDTGDNPTDTLTVFSLDHSDSQDVVVTVHGVTDNLPVTFIVNHGLDTVNDRKVITGFDFNDILKAAGDLTFTGTLTVTDFDHDGHLDTLVEFSYSLPGNGNAGGNGNGHGNGNGNDGGNGNNFATFEVVLLGYTGFDAATQLT